MATCARRLTTLKNALGGSNCMLPSFICLLQEHDRDQSAGGGCRAAHLQASDHFTSSTRFAAISNTLTIQPTHLWHPEYTVYMARTSISE